MTAYTTRKPCDADASRRGELERALELLRGGAEPEKVVEALSHRLTRRLLHLPTKLIAGR